MVKIKVPATSANLGCGFDSLGIALSLYTTFTFEEKESGLSFSGCEERFQSKDNLIYVAFNKALAYLNKEIKGLHIDIDCHVPVSRGLGSSATCIVGGLMGAFALTNTPVDKEVIFTLATEMEGHPDNVAPAVFGGLCTCCMCEDAPVYTKIKVDDRFHFMALVPDFETSTKEARKVLPQTLSLNDAIFSLSRVGIVCKAFENYEIDKLRKVMDDKIHEPYRKLLIHEYDDVREICEDIDSVCFMISGSGSTLLNVIEDINKAEEMNKQLQTLSHNWSSYVMSVDKNGAEII